jgi:hypothetical protein
MHELSGPQGLSHAVLDPAGERPATALDVCIALSDESPETSEVPDAFEVCCKPSPVSAEVP